MTVLAIPNPAAAGLRTLVGDIAAAPERWRMGQYEIGPNGTLQRHAQDADEELKPVAA